MGDKVSVLNVMKFAGAYIAFLIGSGFATGQEIMQFFSSNGLPSIISVGISLVLLIYFGSTIMSCGFEYGGLREYKPYKYFCGNIIGVFYEYVVPVLLFISVIVMISGSGATFREYYGLDYYIGCAFMAVLVLIAFLCGLDKLIDIVGVIGPVIVVFSLIVGFDILFRNIDGLKNISETINNINMTKAGGNFISSGIIYAGLNLVGGLFFFTSLGHSANSKKEAKYGAILGSIVLMSVVLVVDLALLSRIGEIYNISIPTLHFAKSISDRFGNIFSIILLCGIFSTAAPNFWTVCDKISRRINYNSKIVAVVVAVVAFFCGLFPFEKLVGNIYPLEGVLGVLLFVCIFFKQISKRII